MREMLHLHFASWRIEGWSEKAMGWFRKCDWMCSIGILTKISALMTSAKTRPYYLHCRIIFTVVQLTRVYEGIVNI
jgi:hypothetical protein